MPEPKIPSGPAVGAFSPRPDPSTQPLPPSVARIGLATPEQEVEKAIADTSGTSGTKQRRASSRPKITQAPSVVARKSTITIPVVPALHQRVRLYANLLGVDIQDMISEHLNEWVPTLSELAKMALEAATDADD